MGRLPARMLTAVRSAVRVLSRGCNAREATRSLNKCVTMMSGIKVRRLGRRRLGKVLPRRVSGVRKASCVSILFLYSDSFSVIIVYGGRLGSLVRYRRVWSSGSGFEGAGWTVFRETAGIDEGVRRCE